MVKLSQYTAYDPEDPLTKTGAERLSAKIYQYWKDKGKEIKIWAEPFVDKRVSTHNMFQIQSNLYRGLPR